MVTRIAIAFGLGLLPATAAPQARATLPRITLDAQIGGIARPERSGPTFYRDQSFTVARIAAAVRLGSKGAFRPVALLDYFGVWGRGDYVSDCRFAPNGTCREYFPTVSGASLGAGVRGMLGSKITLGLTGGIGRYRMGDDAALIGYHADAELALLFSKHAGAVVNVRHIETGQFRGARMWFRPVTVGLRIQ